MQESDMALGQALREILREEISSALTRVQGAAIEGPTRDQPVVQELEGVDPFSLVPFAEHVLREADGGPLHVKEMAPRIYALGFQHRWPPKYSDQLMRSLNSLPSPSQHPDKFERVGPRTLKLRG
jgi:hypothetical protein